MQDIPNDLINKLIFGKFRIIKKEGKGIYATVFSAKNITNQELVALKIQEKTRIFADIEKEAYYLFQIKGIGIPKIVTYGHSGKYNILVEELLGKSLGQLFKENIKKPKRIRLKDMIMAGLQIIERIEYLHSNYILHLDIKPDNFLVGKKDKSLIYIIDFGLARKYRSSRTGKHIKYSKNSYFSGNLKYSSINTMKGIIPSRRDDLESIGYMLIYLYKQKLPWDKIISKNKIELAQKIFDIKRLIPLKMLCEDLPKEMIEYMKYVRTLKFEEEPNYDYLKKILGIMLERINTVDDLNFSWINQALTRNISSCQQKIFFNKRKKISPFSRLLNTNSEDKDKIIESPTKNNNTDIAILKKNIFFPEESKLKKIIIKNKNSMTTKNSIDKNKIIKTPIKKEITNKPNIKKITIKNKKNLNTYNFSNGKIINSRNVLTSNNFPNKSNYQSIKTNNNINYYLVLGPFIPNKDVNVLANKTKKINIDFNQKNNSSNNSNKNIKMNNVNSLKNNSFNKVDIKKHFFKHYNTKNYISPLKYNGLLNLFNEEKFCNDIVYNSKFMK